MQSGEGKTKWLDVTSGYKNALRNKWHNKNKLAYKNYLIDISYYC